MFLLDSEEEDMFLPFLIILYVAGKSKNTAIDYAFLNMIHVYQYDFIGMGIEIQKETIKTGDNDISSVLIWEQDIYTGDKKKQIKKIYSVDPGTTQVKFITDLRELLNITDTPYIRPLNSPLVYDKRKRFYNNEKGTPFIIFTGDGIVPKNFNNIRNTFLYQNIAIYYNSLNKNKTYAFGYYTILSIKNDDNYYIYNSIVLNRDKNNDENTIVTGLLFKQKNGKISFKQLELQ